MEKEGGGVLDAAHKKNGKEEVEGVEFFLFFSLLSLLAPLHFDCLKRKRKRKNEFLFLLNFKMPVVSVNRDRLFEALGKVYSESQSERMRERQRDERQGKETRRAEFRSTTLINFFSLSIQLFQIPKKQPKRNSTFYALSLASNWTMW